MKSFILESRDPFKKVSFFISHEVKKTKYDTLYFGHVLIHKYRTWGFFYQSQLDFISRDISLYKTFTSRPDYNTSSGNHFGKKKAKDENFLFTSLIFYIYFNYSFENILKRHKCYEKGRLSYSAEYRLDQSHNEIISYKKLNKYFRDLLDDRYSVRTPKGHNINSFKTFKISSFEKFQGILSNMSGLENIDDMILFKETNSRLNKKIRMYFNKNKILNRKGEKQLNIKLILNMFFLQRIFNNIELKSFELYKKLLIKVYQDYACFKDPSMLFSYSNYDFEDFLYVFNHLKGRNPVKTFLKWRIYGRLLKDYRKSISNIKKSGVDFSKYREPLNDYRFLSSRYSAENNKDLKLPSSYFSHRKDKLIEFNDLYNIGNISIKLIKNYNDLSRIGALLHNCAGSDETLDYYKNVISLEVIISNKTEYLISISSGEVTQMKGFKNSSPPRELFDLVIIFLKENQLISNSFSYRDACIQYYSQR